MKKTRTFTRCVAVFTAFVAIAAAAFADDKSAAKEKERQLIGVLRSDAPAAEKAITCKGLAVFGSKDAVPALAPLLADKRLSSWARIALEAIPGPEADKALRDATAKVEGRLLVGVINSIGVRRDASAVDGLAGKLNGKDAQVAAAAALALGRIGNAPATKLLRTNLQKPPAGAPIAFRSAVAEGCILSAERLLKEDKAAEAAAIYDEVRQADLPKQRILEATRGAILARKSDGIPLLVEQLRSPDKRFFQIGLMTARELSGSKVTDALAAELVRATPARGALLLRALADRGERVESPAVLQAAKSGPKPVRIAAIGVLGRLGDASSVPTLLELAIENDAELSQAAKSALAELSGKKVDAAIAARLAGAEGNLFPLLIELVGIRRIDATPALLKVLDDPRAQVRAAALTALGETIGPDNLPVLISRAASSQNAEDVSTARKALRAACVRMPDREATAAKLAAAMTGTSTATKSNFLEILGAMGGAKALSTMGAAAKDADPKLQDTASRLLGGWMTVDAGPVLLDLAKTAPGDKYKIRALRGYIRLARQFNMPPAQRAAMCDRALLVSKRPAEQKLVLQVLERYPSVDMLKVAVKATKIPSTKNDATRISLAIAQKLGGGAAQGRKLLAQLGQDPLKVEIIKAEYGAGAKQKDVTAALRKHVGDLSLIALPSPSYNKSLGGDPAPGAKKQLKIKYRINGKPGQASFPENAVIVLPIPK